MFTFITNCATILINATSVAFITIAFYFQVQAFAAAAEVLFMMCCCVPVRVVRPDNFCRLSVFYHVCHKASQRVLCILYCLQVLPWDVSLFSSLTLLFEFQSLFYRFLRFINVIYTNSQRKEWGTDTYKLHENILFFLVSYSILNELKTLEMPSFNISGKKIQILGRRWKLRSSEDTARWLMPWNSIPAENVNNLPVPRCWLSSQSCIRASCFIPSGALLELPRVISHVTVVRSTVLRDAETSHWYLGRADRHASDSPTFHSAWLTESVFPTAPLSLCDAGIGTGTEGRDSQLSPT